MIWMWGEFFTREEMGDTAFGDFQMDPEFMHLLTRIRMEYNRPMIVTSGWRSSKGTAHPMGRAVDIQVYGEHYVRLLGLALKHGMTGIGTQQQKDVPLHKRFLHMDNLQKGEVPDVPRPWGWSY